jgi:hypothetical protein
MTWREWIPGAGECAGGDREGGGREGGCWRCSSGWRGRGGCGGWHNRSCCCRRWVSSAPPDGVPHRLPTLRNTYHNPLCAWPIRPPRAPSVRGDCDWKQIIANLRARCLTLHFVPALHMPRPEATESEMQPGRRVMRQSRDWRRPGNLTKNTKSRLKCSQSVQAQWPRYVGIHAFSARGDPMGQTRLRMVWMGEADPFADTNRPKKSMASITSSTPPRPPQHQRPPKPLRSITNTK